ncbi:hypothetical protein [Calothrix sp. 336/3]|uniref:hypothetical protein n=1 Tax=Calothrix sp. 336/3 TaxID=1337936 RepID=UPI000ACE2857|nr:hypothetical protein [Calothrix sp. 336/3]
MISKKSQDIIPDKLKRFDAAYSIMARLAAFSVACLGTWMCASGNPSNAAFLLGIADIFLKAAQTQTLAPDQKKDAPAQPEDKD